MFIVNISSFFSKELFYWKHWFSAAVIFPEPWPHELATLAGMKIQPSPKKINSVIFLFQEKKKKKRWNIHLLTNYESDLLTSLNQFFLNLFIASLYFIYFH